MKVFKLTIDFKLEVECAMAAVWISLLKLPIIFFAKEALYSIDSVIGTPFMLCEATANRSIVDRARVCVELDLRNPRIPRIYINCGEKSLWQQVVYEGIPSYCTNCLYQGHTMDESYVFGKMSNRMISVVSIGNWKIDQEILVKNPMEQKKILVINETNEEEFSNLPLKEKDESQKENLKNVMVGEAWGFGCWQS